VVHGTFANVLIDNTTKSSSLMVANYVIVIVLAALAFANCTNLVKSRSTMGFFGVCFAIAGFLAALGFAAMIDIKWNVITLWTLPFLMVGIATGVKVIVMSPPPCLVWKISSMKYTGAQADDLTARG
jgi:hypothetical protein